MLERNFTTKPFELKTNTLTTIIQAPPTPPRTRGRALAAGTTCSSARHGPPKGHAVFFREGQRPPHALFAPQREGPTGRAACAPDALVAPQREGRTGRADAPPDARMRHEPDREGQSGRADAPHHRPRRRARPRCICDALGRGEKRRRLAAAPGRSLRSSPAARRNAGCLRLETLASRPFREPARDAGGARLETLAGRVVHEREQGSILRARIDPDCLPRHEAPNACARGASAAAGQRKPARP